MTQQPKFTVVYCRNCDGGYQEFSTARDAVKSVFPRAQIVEKRVDEYPIKVVVKAEIQGTKLDVWSGRQQNLFRKYASKREASIVEIQQNLNGLKKDFELDD